MHRFMFLVAIFSLAATGCSSKNKGYKISGTLTDTARRSCPAP